MLRVARVMQGMMRGACCVGMLHNVAGNDTIVHDLRGCLSRYQLCQLVVCSNHEKYLEEMHGRRVVSLHPDKGIVVRGLTQQLARFRESTQVQKMRVSHAKIAKIYPNSVERWEASERASHQPAIWL
jgi:hypothetical protein